MGSAVDEVGANERESRLRPVPEAVARLVGVVGPRRTAAYPVDRSAIGYFREFCEYADPRSDPARTGPIEAPASFVLTAIRSPSWAADGGHRRHQFVTVSLPLGTTKLVNLGVAHAFIRRLREGERVSFANTIVDVVPKANRLGPGFLVVERIDVYGGADDLVARSTTTNFAYGWPGDEESR
ncbi:MAG TPA: MaoC family dehydratase N-terminal domain-containing protein [Amycolatopsis sp.]|nr:MaoC family dehydratase N-terminal domain-containing protein [Amycolatopsis sp.]